MIKTAPSGSRSRLLASYIEKKRVSAALQIAAMFGVLIATPAFALPVSPLVVTTTADSGAGSLRAALASANNGDTITFSLTLPATITLTTDELRLGHNVTITGPGASMLHHQRCRHLPGV